MSIQLCHLDFSLEVVKTCQNSTVDRYRLFDFLKFVLKLFFSTWDLRKSRSVFFPSSRARETRRPTDPIVTIDKIFRIGKIAISWILDTNCCNVHVVLFSVLSTHVFETCVFLYFLLAGKCFTVFSGECEDLRQKGWRSTSPRRNSGA